MLNIFMQGLLLSASFLNIFIIIEIFRIAADRELLIDKLIAYLQVVYQDSAPFDSKEIDWLGSEIPFKGQVINFSLEDLNRKKQIY
jgi:hypothetical protein